MYLHSYNKLIRPAWGDGRHLYSLLYNLVQEAGLQHPSLNHPSPMLSYVVTNIRPEQTDVNKLQLPHRALTSAAAAWGEKCMLRWPPTWHIFMRVLLVGYSLSNVSLGGWKNMSLWNACTRISAHAIHILIYITILQLFGQISSTNFEFN